MGLALGLVGWGWLASRWVGLIVPLILVGVALRPVFDAWFDRTRRLTPVTVWEAGSIARAHWVTSESALPGAKLCSRVISIEPIT